MKPFKSIKFLIILITTLSLLSGTLSKIFPSLISLPNLTHLMSIQINSLSNFKIWQFFTHILFYPAPQGIHIFYLINLFFGMMILQRMGQIIALHKGELKFLSYFFICGLSSGLAAYLTICHFGINTYYAGPSSALYSLLIATIFLFPRLDFMLFFSASAKGKNLVPILIGIMLLMHLSVGDYIHFFATLTSSITAYIYILFFWNMPSPYKFMKKFDQCIINLSKGKFSSLYQSTKLDKYTNTSRIYDIKTGKAILNEETFINACLEKISKEGKQSLTFYERFKLYRYSKNNNKKKKSHSSYTNYRDN